MTFDEVFENFTTPGQKDLKLNFKKFLESDNLEKKESALIALACSHTVEAKPLIPYLKQSLQEDGATPEEIGEAADAAAVMGIANNYYRFRHWVTKDAYQKAAGFRMGIMMKPVTGKKAFEMMSLAASVINGCEMCCQGHEKALVDLGVSEEAIHDLVRLASTVNGLAIAFRAQEAS